MEKKWQHNTADTETTARVTALTVRSKTKPQAFRTAESINKYNDATRESNSRLNKVKDIEVGLFTLEFSSAKAVLGSFISAFTTDIKPKSIKLDPGGIIMMKTTMETIRTYEECEGCNGIRTTSEVTIINNGKASTIIHFTSNFMNLHPFSYDSQNSFLEKMEEKSKSSRKTYINPITIPFNFILERTK